MVKKQVDARSRKPELIPRPTQVASSIKAAYVPGSDRISLCQQMRIFVDTFEEFATYMRAAIREHLDHNLPWKKQSQSAKDSLQKALSNCTLLRNYEDAWPAEYYARHYMRQLNIRARYVASRTRASSPLPSSPIKAERDNWRGKREGKVRSSVSSKTVGAESNRTKAYISPRAGSRERELPVVEIWATSNGVIINKAQNKVLGFLRSLEPSQERLYEVFIEAGVVNIKYLHVLAQKLQVRKALLYRLEKEKKLRAMQSIIIEDGLNNLLGSIEGGYART